MADLMREIELAGAGRGRAPGDEDQRATRRALAFHAGTISASTSRTPRAGRSPKVRRSRPSCARIRPSRRPGRRARVDRRRAPSLSFAARVAAFYRRGYGAFPMP